MFGWLLWRSATVPCVSLFARCGTTACRRAGQAVWDGLGADARRACQALLIVDATRFLKHICDQRGYSVYLWCYTSLASLPKPTLKVEEWSRRFLCRCGFGLGRCVDMGSGTVRSGFCFCSARWRQASVSSAATNTQRVCSSSGASVHHRPRTSRPFCPSC